jgi:sugar lactone lactonase YvrE
MVTLMVLATAAVPLGTSSAHEDDGGSLPRRIALPRGWQPEGITSDGKSLYAGSLRHGGIWTADPARDTGRILSPGHEGRVAVGLDYDHRRDLLWVAGGATGRIRAHDAHTGKVVARYSFGSGRFVNDLTVTRRGVFATDSFSSELAVVPLRPGTDSLPPASAARTLKLTGDFELVPGEFNLNGIVHVEGTLLAIQSVTGHLFRIDPATGDTQQVAVSRATLTNGDGLELHDDILYVVRNFNNQVVALEVNDRLTHASHEATLRHRSLDVPTTAAVARGALWAVNARFTTTPRPDTRYWITRLPLVDD